MREGIGHDIALASPLQAVIADRGRRLHGQFDVAGFEQPLLFLRVVRPDTRKAVGLQLDSHLEVIGINLVHAALRFLREYSGGWQALRL